MQDADVILLQNANVFPPTLEKSLEADENTFTGKPFQGFTDIPLFHGISSAGGYPALSLPIGFSSPQSEAPVGFPVNLQLVGRRNDEEKLVRIGYAYQKKFGVVKAPDLTAGMGSVAVNMGVIPRLLLMFFAVWCYAFSH